MSDRKVQQTFIGFALGLGIGAAVAILFAPKSGEDTRQYLLDSATDAFDGAVAKGRRLKGRAQRAVADVGDQLTEAAEGGENAYRKAKGA